MSPTLKSYRVYSFDSVHQIVSAHLIEATDDQHALAKAEAAGFGSKCEIWQGRRLVAELGSERQQA